MDAGGDADTAGVSPTTETPALQTEVRMARPLSASLGRCAPVELGLVVCAHAEG